MNAISQILTADQILLDLDASSKKRVFEHAGMLFEQKLGMPRASIFDSLFAREKLGSTGLGQGIAIPHGRIPDGHPLTAVFLTLEQAIAFDAIDNQPVDILFALLVPESECKTHLKTLSLIASKLNDKAFCRQLRQAEDDEALYQLMIAP